MRKSIKGIYHNFYTQMILRGRRKVLSRSANDHRRLRPLITPEELPVVDIEAFFKGIQVVLTWTHCRS